MMGSVASPTAPENVFVGSRESIGVGVPLLAGAPAAQPLSATTSAAIAAARRVLPMWTTMRHRCARRAPCRTVECNATVNFLLGPGRMRAVDGVIRGVGLEEVDDERRSMRRSARAPSL